MLWSLPLLSLAVLVPVDLAALALVLYLTLPPKRVLAPLRRETHVSGSRSRDGRRLSWWVVAGVAALIGAAVGATLIWYVGDVKNAFGVSPTWVDRIWAGAVLAAVAVAVANVWRGRWWRKSIAIVSMLVFVTAGGLAINRDASAYQTLGEAAGTASVQPLPLSTTATTVPRKPSDVRQLPQYARSQAFDPHLYAAWVAPSNMPRVGTIGSVRIPGTVSHFPARPAIVYLPPAALVKNPPALPVVIMLSGQPGDPNSLLVSGHLGTTLDTLAAAHHGLAPIVVIPDQLGSTYANPLCVDGPLGNSATYLTTDVPHFIQSHFHVAQGRQGWAIGGFSQGGTCAIQLGAAYPSLFASLIDVSGELGPSLTTRAETIHAGFSGSLTRYEQAQPVSILKNHTPYDAFNAFFAVGQSDSFYRSAMITNSEAAEGAGMHVTRDVIPGSGHDWTTATVGMAQGLTNLYPPIGLAAEGPDPAAPLP